MQSGAGYRPRPFKDIPALNQLSFYAEDNLTAIVGGRNISLQAGLRFDNIQPEGIWQTKTGTIFSPRFNFSYDLTKNISVHLGYGIAAKAPTLLYLYPDNAYYDLINFNYFAANPAERLVILTTRAFNTENKDLKILRNEKKELGFNWEFAPHKRLTVTAFYEKAKNAYSFGRSFSSIKMVPLDIYGIASAPSGQPPVLQDNPIRTDTFIADYSAPANDNIRVNKGIEFDLDLGRFDDLRTSFVANGAWINSRSTYKGYDFFKYLDAGKAPARIGIFEAKGNERTSTTLRAIHNIPELRLVITFSAQTIWSQKNIRTGTDSIATGYIRRDNSQVVWLSKGERDQISSSDKELFRNIAREDYITDSYNPLWLFNLRLTKEIGKHIGFSFFANNLFMNRRLESGTRNPNEFTRRNPALFFGTELNIRL
jgi:outer membrane receptor protein involved in Fe transport